MFVLRISQQGKQLKSFFNVVVRFFQPISTEKWEASQTQAKIFVYNILLLQTLCLHWCYTYCIIYYYYKRYACIGVILIV